MSRLSKGLIMLEELRLLGVPDTEPIPSEIIKALRPRRGSRATSPATDSLGDMVPARVVAMTAQPETVRCHYCGLFMDKLRRSRDHVIPLSRGGRNKRENLVWACKPCNRKKSGALPVCRCGVCVLAIKGHLSMVRSIHREAPSRGELLAALVVGLKV